MMSSPAPARTAAAAPGPAATAAQDADGGSFLDHVWNVINPLQHLPVVGTVYRAATGEHIGTMDKIAGDTLYGGVWGAISSVADAAFEGLTGKSAEETVLALFKSDDTPKTGIAMNLAMPQLDDSHAAIPSVDLPALPPDGSVAANAPIPKSLDVLALSSALSAKGVDGDTAGRALYAYRRSMGLPAATPVLASVN
jgi:hypothetical protein